MQGTNHPLSHLLRRLNGVLRGWTHYFRHGVSKGLRRPAPAQLAAGGRLTAPCRMEIAATALPGQRVDARARRRGAVRLSSSAGDPLSYRGAAIPTPWDGTTTKEVA